MCPGRSHSANWPRVHSTLSEVPLFLAQVVLDAGPIVPFLDAYVGAELLPLTQLVIFQTAPRFAAVYPAVPESAVLAI